MIGALANYVAVSILAEVIDHRHSEQQHAYAKLLANKVFTRQQLLDRIFGEGYAVTDRTVDAHIKALRKKLSAAGADPDLIETERGVGYRLKNA